MFGPPSKARRFGFHCLAPLFALRAAAPAGRAVRPGRVAPCGFLCLTPLCALRAAAPAGRPFGRVALLPAGCLPRAAMRAARGGSGGAAFRSGRVAPFGLFASRRYARFARRLRRGGLSAGSRCSRMSQSVLLRQALGDWLPRHPCNGFLATSGTPDVAVPAPVRTPLLRRSQGLFCRRLGAEAIGTAPALIADCGDDAGAGPNAAVAAFTRFILSAPRRRGYRDGSRPNR